MLVLWAWSRVFMHLIEVASVRGLIQIPPRRESVRDIVTGADPVLASTRLGRILFWLVAFTMLYILLVFAFWGSVYLLTTSLSRVCQASRERR